MVKGLDIFRAYFKDFTEQYVLIGGSACDVSFSKENIPFRTTKDLDMVLIVEALTKEFTERFWQFIKEGAYRNKAKSSGNPQFYRFDKPNVQGYPYMIELFTRSKSPMPEHSTLTPIYLDDAMVSLSGILLNDAYYELLLKGRKVVDDVSVLKPTYILVFKAKAWLDLSDKKQQGFSVKNKDILKHRNDIIRIASEFKLELCPLPKEIKEDMVEFINHFHINDLDLMNLGIHGLHEEEIVRLLKDTYLQ